MNDKFSSKEATKTKIKAALCLQVTLIQAFPGMNDTIYTITQTHFTPTNKTMKY